MSMYRLYPRLSADRASILRRKLLASPTQAMFDPVLLEELMADPSAFPPTGGKALTVSDLRGFRDHCVESLTSGLDQGSWSTAEFDLEMGRALYGQSSGSTGEFGNAQVWDFLTLALLPDLALKRFPNDAKGAASRLTGGNRRHVFQRLWRRWKVFGREIVESTLLTEDDYGAILERHLTSQMSEVAQRSANAICASGRAGSARREFTRVFMRQLVQTSGLVSISNDDPEHLDALFEHVAATTRSLLNQKSANAF